MDSPNELIHALTQFRARLGTRLFPVDESTFMMQVKGEHGNWMVTCSVLNETVLSVSSFLPVTVPASERRQVMEYLTRANAELSFGNFDMNPDGGSVRFRTSIAHFEGEITDYTLGMLVTVNISLADHYLQGLQQVLFAGRAPAQVLRLLRERLHAASAEADLEDLLADVDLDQLPDDEEE